jgi:hypothetical protein
VPAGEFGEPEPGQGGCDDGPVGGVGAAPAVSERGAAEADDIGDAQVAVGVG